LVNYTHAYFSPYFWAYPRIAEAYTKHEQPLGNLKKYLDSVSELPVVLPENKEDAKQRVQDTKLNMISRQACCVTPVYKEELHKVKSDEPSSSMALEFS
jgi:hypothetical protein